MSTPCCGRIRTLLPRRCWRSGCVGAVYLRPLSGAPDRWVIEASWGLREAVVAGMVSPGLYIRPSGGLLEARQGTKERPLLTDGDASGRGGRPQPLGPRAQTPAEREERVIVRVPYVDRYLRLRPRPGHRQLAGERTLTEKHIRDAGALAARQP
jgi:Pyruvate phosphate dikinase, AMP/ATP-binding domain